jgi:DNA topoisomerase-1
MKLVIVESPSKAKTIEKYLGGDFKVTSSIGHVRDLPKSNNDAIDIKRGFIPHYEISAGKKKVVDDLIKKAEKSDEVFLATDPDREGEAIAWHLEELLRADKKVTAPIKRVTFNEITKDVVLNAIKNPRHVDTDLRKAQEARRVLDRLVGYDLSGLIWKKLRYGLSAGRVQSPALRIIMEREREIRAFVPEDYFVLTGSFQLNHPALQAPLLRKEGKELPFPLICDEEPRNQQEVDRILELGKNNDWKVLKIKETETKRNPRAPFTTSTLQQAASTYLGFSPSRTMQVAQRLYEAGHITYMRTDSPTLSKQAQSAIVSLVTKEHGVEYVEPKEFKSRSKNAQEAHEGIRPTDFMKKSVGDNQNQIDLYELIWKRTVASQMAPATMIKTKVSANITTSPQPSPSKGEGASASIPNFSTTGSRMIFDGWLKIDSRARGEDVEVPKLSEGDSLDLLGIDVEAKQTQPPNRYSEAGLVKELEKRGIGRPSTYASIMKTLEARGYVEKQGRTLFPTDTGDIVSSFLEEHFMEYIDDVFTANMEDQLDHIAAGQDEYEKVLSRFYTPFTKALEAKADIPKINNLGEADSKFTCPVCKKGMVIKLGRGGKFLSCSTFPDCDGALSLDGKEIGKEEPLGKHPQTGENIYVLSGRFGPYVQLGESPKIPALTKFEKGHRKTDEEKEMVKKEKADRAAVKNLSQPKRASIPKHIDPEHITMDQAVHLLILPRDLGPHPDDGEMVIANIGKFGPYVGHMRNFRSIKPTSGLDPYTITLDEALTLLNTPKSLPKGTKLVRIVGKHPKTGKELQILESKSGKYVPKGLQRIYLPDGVDVEKLDVEGLLKLM